MWTTWPSYTVRPRLLLSVSRVAVMEGAISANACCPVRFVGFPIPLMLFVYIDEWYSTTDRDSSEQQEAGPSLHHARWLTSQWMWCLVRVR